MRDGYLDTKDEHKGDIPERLEGAAKYQKMFFDVLKELTKGIDGIFDKWFFLKWVPSFIRYLICLLLVCGPGIVMLVILCGEEEDEEAGGDKKVPTAVEGAAA